MAYSDTPSKLVIGTWIAMLFVAGWFTFDVWTTPPSEAVGVSVAEARPEKHSPTSEYTFYSGAWFLETLAKNADSVLVQRATDAEIAVAISQEFRNVENGTVSVSLRPLSGAGDASGIVFRFQDGAYYTIGIALVDSAVSLEESEPGVRSYSVALSIAEDVGELPYEVASQVVLATSPLDPWQRLTLLTNGTIITVGLNDVSVLEIDLERDEDSIPVLADKGGVGVFTIGTAVTAFRDFAFSTW